MDHDAPIERSGFGARAARWAGNAILRAQTAWWFVTRPKTFGVRAVPITPEGHVVLVRHSYVPGWHLPGGGRGRREDSQAAMLRELREEIGLLRHAAIRQVEEYFHRPNFKRDTVSLFVVDGVECDPRPSLEIEAIGAFDPRALPEGTAPTTRLQVARWALSRYGDG